MLQITAVPIRGTIKTLDVAWNHIGDEAMATLRKNWPPCLSSLRLDWNFIGEVGASHLGAALASATAERALQSLDLRSNPLGDRGVVAICEGVSECVSLRWLGLGETQLTDTGARDAMPFLQRHLGLTGLDLGENKLTDAGCNYVAQVIADAPSLQTMLLRGYLFEPTRVGDAGGATLVHAVAQRTGYCLPFELHLDYQQVGCRTATEVARCCCSWSRISLFNTRVATEGALALAQAFRQHPCARAVRLNIAQCCVGAGAVKLLRDVGFQRLDSHGQRSH